MESFQELVRGYSSSQYNLPFESSQLTILLKDSIGGSSKTLFIGVSKNESSHLENMTEILQKIKTIQNKTKTSKTELQFEVLKLKEQVSFN